MAEVEAEIGAIQAVMARHRLPAAQARRVAIAVLTIAALDDPAAYDRAWALLWNDRQRRLEAGTAGTTQPAPLTGARHADLSTDDLGALVRLVEQLEGAHASLSDEERAAATEILDHARRLLGWTAPG